MKVCTIHRKGKTGRRGGGIEILASSYDHVLQKQGRKVWKVLGGDALSSIVILSGLI